MPIRKHDRERWLKENAELVTFYGSTTVEYLLKNFPYDTLDDFNSWFGQTGKIYGILVSVARLDQECYPALRCVINNMMASLVTVYDDLTFSQDSLTNHNVRASLQAYMQLITNLSSYSESSSQLANNRKIQTLLQQLLCDCRFADQFIFQHVSYLLQIDEFDNKEKDCARLVAIKQWRNNANSQLWQQQFPLQQRLAALTWYISSECQAGASFKAAFLEAIRWRAPRVFQRSIESVRDYLKASDLLLGVDCQQQYNQLQARMARLQQSTVWMQRRFRVKLANNAQFCKPILQILQDDEVAKHTKEQELARSLALDEDPIMLQKLLGFNVYSVMQVNAGQWVRCNDMKDKIIKSVNTRHFYGMQTARKLIGGNDPQSPNVKFYYNAIEFEGLDWPYLNWLVNLQRLQQDVRALRLLQERFRTVAALSWIAKSHPLLLMREHITLFNGFPTVLQLSQETQLKHAVMLINHMLARGDAAAQLAELKLFFTKLPEPLWVDLPKFMSVFLYIDPAIFRAEAAIKLLSELATLPVCSAKLSRVLSWVNTFQFAANPAVSLSDWINHPRHKPDKLLRLMNKLERPVHVDTPLEEHYPQTLAAQQQRVQAKIARYLVPVWHKSKPERLQRLAVYQQKLQYLQGDAEQWYFMQR